MVSFVIWYMYKGILNFFFNYTKNVNVCFKSSDCWCHYYKLYEPLASALKCITIKCFTVFLLLQLKLYSGAWICICLNLKILRLGFNQNIKFMFQYFKSMGRQTGAYGLIKKNTKVLSGQQRRVESYRSKA